MSHLLDRDLLDILSEINFRLTHHRGDPHSSTDVLERYSGLIASSSHGKRCFYASRYRDMFIDHDYPVVRALILEAADIIRSIDPGDKPPISISHGEEENYGSEPD